MVQFNCRGSLHKKKKHSNELRTIKIRSYGYFSYYLSYFSREDIALPSTFVKGEPFNLKTTDIDTTDLEDDNITVNAVVEFSLNQKDYKLHNELVFTIK